MRNQQGQFKEGFRHSQETVLKMVGRVPWNKGKKHSAESIEKMRQSHIGKHVHSEIWKQELSEKMKGNQFSLGWIPTKNWIKKQRDRMIGNKIGNNTKGFLGHFHTQETKEKISLKKSGENNHNWKGGITPIHARIRGTKEYKLWRKSVFERGGHVCQDCGDDTIENLQADHIKPFSLYPELRFAIDNGRILCIGCHNKTDTFGGRIKSFKLKHLYA